MRYLTARKRAEGKGASGTGTEHHWYMQLSAVGLALIVPTFLYVIGNALGSSHEVVVETFSRPVPVLLAGLVVVFGLQHFRKGAKIMIEDYTRGVTRKALIIFLVVFTYGLTATALYALAKLAL
jgi:succinate dehydrogenase / fumarate reductase membrane anchor subunit